VNRLAPVTLPQPISWPSRWPRTYSLPAPSLKAETGLPEESRLNLKPQRR
jgi:hypothetical protein